MHYDVQADVESLSQGRILQIWKRQTCHGSVAGFGNGLLEQEADGHGHCVERGRVELPSPSYLPFRSRCCQLCGAEILIGVRLMLRFAPLDWRLERWGEESGMQEYRFTGPTTGTDSRDSLLQRFFPLCFLGAVYMTQTFN